MPYQVPPTPSTTCINSNSAWWLLASETASASIEASVGLASKATPMRLKRRCDFRGLGQYFFGRNLGFFHYRFFAAECHPNQKYG